MTTTNKNTNGKSSAWKRNLIIGTVGISIGVFIAIIYAFVQSKPDKEPAPSPTTKERLTLIKVNPQPPVFESIWSTEKITLTFNKPIDQKTIYHQISPPEDLKIIFSETSPTSFSFVPLTGWEENIQYTLSVSKRLSSPSGEQLEKDVEIKFTRKTPENLPEPIENY